MQFIGILLLAAFFLFPLFHLGVPVSHDGENHIARFASYYQAFQDGHFPARWAGNLNFGYGTPVFLFFYPLPGILASILHFIGFSFASSFKLLLGISFIAAFLTFYIWARTIFSINTARIGALLYGLVPYHFLNVYVRGDIGELLAYVFVPLVFWAIDKTQKTNQLSSAILGGLFYGLLIISHNGVSLMFSPVFLLYAIVRSSERYRFLKMLPIFFVGLSLAAFFWIPALYEGRYVNAHFFIGSMYQQHFPSLLQLIVSPWGFGPEVRKVDGLSPQVGLLYITFVVASIVLFLRQKKQIILMWLSVFFGALLITLPVSDFVWSTISFLRLYEFPWRFVGLASFIAVVLACYVVNEIKDKKSLIVVAIVLLVTSIPFVQVKEYIQQDDAFYQSFTGTTYFHGEASPIWTAGDPSSFAKAQIEIIGGEGVIQQIEKKTHEHTFTIDAKSSVTIVDNTLYFPGWKVIHNGQEVPIQFQDPNHRGLITFQVPEGKHTITVQFQETKVRFLANSISLSALLVIVIFFILTLLYNKRRTYS